MCHEAGHCRLNISAQKRSANTTAVKPSNIRHSYGEMPNVIENSVSMLCSASLNENENPPESNVQAILRACVSVIFLLSALPVFCRTSCRSSKLVSRFGNSAAVAIVKTGSKKKHIAPACRTWTWIVWPGLITCKINLQLAIAVKILTALLEGSCSYTTPSTLKPMGRGLRAAINNCTVPRWILFVLFWTW